MNVERSPKPKYVAASLLRRVETFARPPVRYVASVHWGPVGLGVAEVVLDAFDRAIGRLERAAGAERTRNSTLNEYFWQRVQNITRQIDRQDRAARQTMQQELRQLQHRDPHLAQRIVAYQLQYGDTLRFPQRLVPQPRRDAPRRAFDAQRSIEQQLRMQRGLHR